MLHYGDLTYESFFSKFYNQFLLFNINTNIYKFKRDIFLNQDNLVSKVIAVFSKFNIFYKF